MMIKLSEEESPFRSRTSFLRICFVVSLLAAAAVCGVIAQQKIESLETEVGVQTYESVAASLLSKAQATTLRKLQGGNILASMYSHSFPDASQWPFVALPGYLDTANAVANQSDSLSLFFNPIVKPEDINEFEHFAWETYRKQSYPETAGTGDFGFGMWRFDPERGRPHRVKRNAATVWNWDPEKGEYDPILAASSNETDAKAFLTPVFQHNNKDASSMLFDVHSETFRANAIDSMIACAEEGVSSTSTTSPECGVATQIIELVIRQGPATLIFQPIYPANDPTELVGYVGTSVHWEDVLLNVVPDYVDGIDCVVTGESKTFTYTIYAGKPQLRGEGDLHDPEFSDFGHSVILNPIPTDASASVVYTLEVYPTRLILDEFHTSSSIAVSVGFVAVIIFCTAVFFVYDFFMKHESRQRKVILEIKRQFVRFISHEIRTPLNTVCMGLELLESDIRSHAENCRAQKRHSYSDMTSLLNATNIHVEANKNEKEVLPTPYWLELTTDILENSNNAVSVLNDLLNYDKVESGSLKLQIDTVYIWDLLRKTVDQFQIQAKNCNISLNLHIESKDVEKGGSENNKNLEKLNVMGDDIRLRQVIRNLISNAIKFTPEKGRVEVFASYLPKGLPNAKPVKREGETTPAFGNPRAGSIRITVIDDGAGMSPDQIEHVFSEGVQFDPNKLQAGGGSGLGLFISNGIVVQHGGTLQVFSEGIGHGSTFTVELPLYQFPLDMDDGADNKSDSVTVAMSDYQHSERKRRVMVVDDILSNRKMLVRLLERCGHSCTIATNGQEAVDAYVADRAMTELNENHILIDTILMDFEMPVLDGPDATRKLRELGCTADIIGVTGNVLPEDVQFFKDQGANEVLSKPVRIALLKDYWARNGDTSS